MKNKTLYTLFAILFLASFVSANTYQVFQTAPDTVSSSAGQMLVYENFTKMSDSIGSIWNLRYNVFNVTNGDVVINLENLSIPSRCFDAYPNVVSLAFTYWLTWDTNWHREFYCFNGSDYELIEINITAFDPLVYSPATFYNFNPASRVLQGYYNITTAYVYTYALGGRWAQIKEANSTFTSDWIGMLGTGITWDILNETPQQNIQTNNFEILGASGYGISAFFGGLLNKGFFGLIMVALIIVLIVLVIGAVFYVIDVFFRQILNLNPKWYSK